MSSRTIREGNTIFLHPLDKRVIAFDWDTKALVSTVTIASSSWTIDVVKQNGATAISDDNDSILSGNRKTQVRLDATTASEGDLYTLINTIVTDESPAQTIARSCPVFVTADIPD
jgi:hypothetical protein